LPDIPIPKTKVNKADKTTKEVKVSIEKMVQLGRACTNVAGTNAKRSGLSTPNKKLPASKLFRSDRVKKADKNKITFANLPQDVLQVLTEEDMDDLDPQQNDLQASGSLFSEADHSGRNSV